MDSVETYQKRLRDGTAAVENEINARTQQIEGLTKRLEGLKRALELFRSDQAAITELLPAITELLREPQSGFKMEIPVETKSGELLYARLVISLGAIALLFAQAFWQRWKLEPVALGLVALAALPWLSSIIQSAKVGNVEISFRSLERKQTEQRAELDKIIQFLLENFVSKYEIIHLEKLASGDPFPFQWGETFEAELRRLIGLGLIERLPGKDLHRMKREGGDAHNYLRITERGTNYLKYRQGLAEAFQIGAS
jgi:hypothetical protein